MNQKKSIFPDRRIVTKASKDGTFKVGDHITLYENGDIGCQEAYGWIPYDQVPEATIGMESRPDIRFFKNRRYDLLQEAKTIQDHIRQLEKQ